MTWFTDMKQAPSEVLPYVVFFFVLASVLLLGVVVWMLVRRVRYRHPVYDNLISFEQRGREIRRRKRKLLRIRWHPITPVFGLIALGAIWYAYELGSLGSAFGSAGFGRTLEGHVTRVRDGDTIVVGGTPVRFANLDCAELGTPAGDRAGRRMTELVSGERITCSLSGRRSYDRMIGECRMADGRSLSRVMVREDFLFEVVVRRSEGGERRP